MNLLIYSKQILASVFRQGRDTLKNSMDQSHDSSEYETCIHKAMMRMLTRPYIQKQSFN